MTRRHEQPSAHHCTWPCCCNRGQAGVRK